MTVLSVVHPFFFATAFVLERFVQAPSNIRELVRPLLVALIAAGLLLLISRVITRRMIPGALLASFGIILFALRPVPMLVMLIGGLWWTSATALRAWREGIRPTLGIGAWPVVLAVISSSVLLIVALGSTGWALLPHLETRPMLPEPSSVSPKNDIYVLILDAYPRADTLAEEFGMSNSGFEQELSELGFTVASEATANYTKTWLTMASLLSAQYIHDLPEIAAPPDGTPAQARLAEELINDGAVLEVLREQGYEIVSIPSAIPSTDVTSNATVRQVANLTSLEIALITSSLPSRLFSNQMLDLLASEAAGYSHAQLELLSDVARAPGTTPRFVITHLMAPHAPFVLGQSPDYLRVCFPRCVVWETAVGATRMTDEEYASRMRTQIQALNERVSTALTTIVESDPEATIILMSDHGARHDASDTDEHFRILFAARSGALDVSFPDDIAPVNVFRRILSSAFDMPLSDVPYEAWESHWTLPLELTRHR